MNPFITQTLHGSRYEGGRLPLAVLREFAVFEKLVRIAARGVFLRSNPGRRHVSPGFSKAISLYLKGAIEEGSAVACIYGETVASDDNGAAACHEEGRDEVLGLIATMAEGGVVPSDLSLDLVQALRSFGQSLVADEYLECVSPRADTRVGRVSPRTRQAWVDWSSGELERSIECAGTVTLVDNEHQYFNLLVDGERTVTRCDLPIQYRSQVARASRFDYSVRVSVSGTGVYRFAKLDSPELLRVDKLQSMRLTSRLAMESVPGRSERMAMIRELKDGWCNGDGKAISDRAVHTASELLDSLENALIPAPHIFPTEEGGVSAEWTTRSVVMSCEVLPDGTVELMAIGGEAPIDHSTSPSEEHDQLIKAIYGVLAR